MCVWTGVWYWTRDTEISRAAWFWVAGFFLTGVTLVFLGLILGPLGRAARHAELPPTEALRAEAAIQQTAAAHPPAVVMPTPNQQMGAQPQPTANPVMPATAATPPARVVPAQ